MSQEATKANKATKTVSASNFKPKNSEQKHQISNVIGMLWMPHNSERLLALVHEGLGSLREGYFSGGQSETLDGTARHASGGSHDVRLAVFFLLLNVDEHLKQRIIDMETKRNHAKVTRFYDDLHHRLAHDFLTNEKQSVQDFLAACEEAWLLA